MTYLSLPLVTIADHSAVSHLRRDYEVRRALFDAQPALVQRFLEAQARMVASAILQNVGSVRFALPDQVLVGPAMAADQEPGKNGSGEHMVSLPAEQRQHKPGRFALGTNGAELGDRVREHLMGLEQSAEPGVAISAALLRYAIAHHMVYDQLPAGRSVNYVAAEGEEIPSLPDPNRPEFASAITQPTDAIVEEDSFERGSGGERGELQVPFVPFARCFYLPQWVAFDAEGRLLTGTLAEAEAQIGSMQRFVAVLRAAVSLAPYFVADETYQQKRYGILGQLVNQGRALAWYKTHQIISIIQRRALAHELNRGLSLSLPYFDDQALKLKAYPFVVIPAGRIMFVPAFVVRATREEAARVAQDTRLSPSARRHLLSELASLEQAFVTRRRPPQAAEASAMFTHQ